jgi:hypothetical protein
LKTIGPLDRTSHQDVPNIQLTCNLIVTLGNLIVGCRLEEYVRITINTFYLLESVRILPWLR